MKRTAALFLLATAVAILPGQVGAADALPAGRPLSIVSPDGASVIETVAAREIHRYVYLRTGELLPIVQAVPDRGGAIIVGRKDRAVVKTVAADKTLNASVAGLMEQEYILKTVELKTGPVVLITGGDDVGTLYGAYRFAEHLGVRFYLHGDVIPDRPIELKLPLLDEQAKPLFELRGIQPFHDFPEGPDWWNVDDYKAVISQLPKMRMNFIGLHTYPEGGPNAEPTVWIGLPGDVAEDGTVKFSYPSSYNNTLRRGWNWGYAPKKTAEFAFGASALFERDAYGADVMLGICPRPERPEDCNKLFNRTAAMLHEAFAHARLLGVKTCVGTETALRIPKRVQERLKATGKEPSDPSVVQELYEGIFTRAARAYPIDYYWFWTPEGWTWGSPPDAHVEHVKKDLAAAVAAWNKVRPPFGLATCGWVLGPQDDRAMFDKVLPKHVAMSCINRQVGKAPVNLSFARVAGRQKWAIPWLEDDPGLTSPQLWVGRMRRDAADALRYGCTGLLGLHWRTRVLGPNVSALAKAAWDQTSWESDQRGFWPLNGNPAAYKNRPIAETEDDVLYQTMLWDISLYRLSLPNGVYTVTLKFNESHFSKKGQRVFDVTIQGEKVLDKLDIVASVGYDTALDHVFKNIKVTHGYLDIEFVRHKEHATIAAIAVEGRAATLKVNVAGPAYKDYAPDMPRSSRFCPTDDFYLDWASTQFGPQVSADVARIFQRLDGRLPEPAGWFNGPGGFGSDDRPWEMVRREYAFVDELAAVRPRVPGPGNTERFDYWLNTFEYMRSMARLRCVWAEFNRAMAKVNAETDPETKRRLARELALPKRKEIIGALGKVYTYMLATVSNPGEMGTVANWEQHIGPSLLANTGNVLADALGEALPPDAMPAKRYEGPARIIVPAVRSDLAAGESLTLKVILLVEKPPKEAVLYWREMGKGKFARVPLVHVARGVYTVRFPPDGAMGANLEYYITAHTVDGKDLYFPATAPSMNQTLIIVPGK